MDGKDKDSGTLKTVFEDDEEYGSSEELPTVDATPKGPYQRELDKLRQQLLAQEQKVKQQEELLLQYATPIKPTVTDPTLTPRVPRPQDIAYQERIRRQKEQEETMKTDPTAGPNPEIFLAVLQNLANIVIDNKNATDVTEPPKFSGRTEDWDTWYQQFRTYLKAKGWLDTFLHPTGPGTPGFNQDINEKIYNKLTILCGRGNALTYVQSAAEFDGHGAGQQLLARYDGFSKQRNNALRKLIANLRHTSGTSITDHTDLFEKLCGQITSSGKPPTDEEKLDWFLDSVTEPIYEYTKQHCKHLKLMGTLTYSVMANLYKLTCFEKYPHFHVKAQTESDKTLINNALHSNSHGRGRGRRQGFTSDKGKGRQKGKGDRHGKGKSKGRGRNPSQTRHKGKGRGSAQQKGNADSKANEGATNKNNRTKYQGNCNYCGIWGHLGRDCRKRQAEEAHPSKETTTNSSQQVTFADDDEVEALFNSALFSHDSDSENASTDNEQEANVSDDDMECGKCNSDTAIDAQDNETRNVIQVIDTQDKNTPLPTFESRNETDAIQIQQDANGDPERDTTQQMDETISDTQDQKSTTNSHTLTQDESNEMQQPKEEDEKQSKRARKKTKSHKAEKSTTVKKARNAKRSKTALEPTRPLQPESSSGPTDEPKSCHDWGPPHLIGWGWHPIPFPEDESWTQSRERRERQEREAQIAQGSSPPPKLTSDTDIFQCSCDIDEETDSDTDEPQDTTINPPILALLPTITAKVLVPTPRRVPCCPFNLGLTVDGIVRTKQGQHISVREPTTPQPSSFTPLNHERSHEHDKDKDEPSKPTYTPHLLQYNMNNLKMRYKRITQKRARLMRAIRKTHTQQQQSKKNPDTGQQLPQRKTQPTRKQRKLFHPITIPETPSPPPSSPMETSTNTHTHELSRQTMKRNGNTDQEQSPPPKDLAQNHDDDEEYSSSENDIALYYRAYSRHKPDIDESNAESTTRTQQIEIDYNHLKRQRQAKHDQRRQKTLKIRITTIENPNTLNTHLVRTTTSSAHSEGTTEDTNELTNNAFEHTLDTEHCLYENPDKPQHTYTIDILHDTGASISMLPSDFDFAWTNIRDCLHTISGCLKGTKEKYNQSDWRVSLSHHS